MSEPAVSTGAVGRASKTPVPAHVSSAANAELVDDGLVTLLVLTLHVVEELAALAHHLEEPATRVVVLLVRLEVLGEVVDPLGQDRNLDLGRAGVVRFGGILLDERTLALRRDRHRASFLFGGESGPMGPWNGHSRDVVQQGRQFACASY